MIYKKTFSNYVRIGTIVTTLLFAAIGQNNHDAYASAIKGLTVSPLRTETSIAPGTSQDQTLTVSNTNDRPITVQCY
jgi:P pilus assembly chaperone PapD